MSTRYVVKWFWRIWPFTRLAAVLDERDTLREMTQFRVESLSADDRVEWVMRMSHHIVPIIGDALRKSFLDHGGTNYVEFQCAASDGEEFIVTLQRKRGKTPNQLRLEAEQRLAELSKRRVDPVGRTEVGDYQVKDRTNEIITESLDELRDDWDTHYGSATETLSAAELEMVRGEPRQRFLRLATGGWSDNEHRINEFRKTLIHRLTWKLSAAGGLHIYQYPEDEK